MQKKFLSTRDICFMAIFATITAICAQISIPGPGGVPFTLQTLAVQLSGVILGAKRGAIAIIVYILLGAVGIPVFANFVGGLGVIAGITGGFIVSFPILAFITGLGNSNMIKLAIAIFLGTLLTFAFGLFWATYILHSQITLYALSATATLVIFPFIISEIIKISIATTIGWQIKTALNKSRLLY
ncbi:MAG: biotin transporter BioY [Firmicutes bacterium]|nr:biotin transporter BioY [Bacillota bacterium]